MEWMPADVFSMGMVFYELVTNQIPWFGSSPEEVRTALNEGERLDDEHELSHTAAAAAGLPDAVCDVIAGCWGGLIAGKDQVWHNEPEKRPTAQQVAVLLADISVAVSPVYIPSAP
jgi:hypothetical protein